MSNAYYNPEELDLVILKEVEWSDECYQFDKTVLWKHKDGRIFIASDAGCSCPTPFDECYSIDDLTEVTSHKKLAEYLEQRAEDYYNDAPTGKADLISAYQEATRG